MALLNLGMAATGRPTFDLTRMWAAFLGLPGQQVIGFAVHLAVSVAVAALYAVGFALAGAADVGWAWGLVGATLHWLVGGVFLASVPATDDGRPSPAPGPFAMRLGAPAALTFLAAHVAFGLVVGVSYFALHSGGGLDAAL